MVINVFGIGDVLFSTPLLRNLRNNFPSAKIYYLCNKKTAPLLKSHHLIEDVFVYERDEFAAEWKRSRWAGFKKYIGFINEIRGKKIDASIDLSLNTPFSFFAWAAGIRNRFGLNYKKRGVFLTKSLEIEGFVDKHVVEYYLDTLKLLGIEPVLCPTEVYSNPGGEEWAEKFLKDAGGIKDKSVLIGVAPCGGASWGMQSDSLRWPENKFIELIDRIGEKNNVTVVLFGSPEESPVCARIERSVRKPLINAAGKTSFEQFASLLKKCSIAVCNDAGPIHVAVASGIKTVCICGPVDEKVYAQFRLNGNNLVVKKDISCRPCYNKFRLTFCRQNKRCLTDISVQEVFDAVNSLLE